MTRQRLFPILRTLAPGQAKHPPEPTEEVVAGLRTHVDDAMSMMGFRGPA